MSDFINITNQVKLELDKFVIETKLSLQELKKTAISQAWKILQLAVVTTVQVLQNLATDLSGPDKKNIAMNALSDFYDKVFLVIDIPFVPSVIEPLFRKYVKTLLMLLVSSSIDAMVTTFKQIGIFKSEPIKIQKSVTKKSIRSKKKRK